MTRLTPDDLDLVVANDDGSPDGRSEAAIGAALALAAVAPIEVEPGALYQLTVPPGSVSATVDLERFLPGPRRPSGVYKFTDAASLVAYVQANRTPGTELYVDSDASTMTAVLNGDDSTARDYGWGDHRAELTLKHTPEWLAWRAVSGKLLDQVAFAEFLEDRLVEIVEPTGAAMLELAQTFEATTGVEFESSSMLDSGQRRIGYKETTNARAGQTGQIDVPKELILALRPYKGGEAYKVTARFRFRIGNGNLQLGVTLNRITETLEAAFADVRVEVENALGAAYAGTPAPACSS